MGFELFKFVVCVVSILRIFVLFLFVFFRHVKLR